MRPSCFFGKWNILNEMCHHRGKVSTAENSFRSQIPCKLQLSPKIPYDILKFSSPLKTEKWRTKIWSVFLYHSIWVFYINQFHIWTWSRQITMRHAILSTNTQSNEPQYVLKIETCTCRFEPTVSSSLCWRKSPSFSMFFDHTACRQSSVIQWDKHWRDVFLKY